MPDVLTAFGLLAIVLTLSALVSGVVERIPLSFPMLFLGIGMLLSEHGLGLLFIDAHDRTLETVATVSLALVLFLDAVKLRFDDGRTAWLVPSLVLGPGTLLTIGLIAAAAALLLRTPLLTSVLLGAILASTDPVVLRDVLHDRRIPQSVRRVLSIEAGTNDVVVLPIVLVLIALAQAQGRAAGDWLAFLARLFVLSPAVGFVVGGAGSWLMRQVDARLSIRREYQALYGLGLVLAAYTAGQAVQGDGFLASFAAGAAVVILNQELCDCFLEYGEVTAEMAMLLAFVLFGALLASLLATGPVPLLPALAFAGLTIFVARPLAQALVLSRAAMSFQARAFVAWFGPRGLNSLLLALLVVINGVPGGERLLSIVGVVVLFSVVVHGMTATPLGAWYARKLARETLPEERQSGAAGLLLPAHDPEAVPRITPVELARRLEGPEPPLVMDVRTRSQYDRDEGQIPGSVRVLPDEVANWAARQRTPAQRNEVPGSAKRHEVPQPATGPAARLIVTYCT
ncbi:MAG: cation:proton antiporter [Chloroflexi bacterium]|nr:cation:proton antiporter [Chloroflexota bacterium]